MNIEVRLDFINSSRAGKIHEFMERHVEHLPGVGAYHYRGTSVENGNAGRKQGRDGD